MYVTEKVKQNLGWSFNILFSKSLNILYHKSITDINMMNTLLHYSEKVEIESHNFDKCSYTASLIMHAMHTIDKAGNPTGLFNIIYN